MGCHRQVGSTGEGRVGDLRGGVSWTGRQYWGGEGGRPAGWGVIDR